MNGEKLNAAQVVLLVSYAAAMAVGQFLFKAAALRMPAGPLAERIAALLQDVVFLAAVALYAALVFVCVWILTFTPLSRAYAFVAVAFALTPLLGVYFFGEPFTLRLAIGVAIICLGLVVVVG